MVRDREQRAVRDERREERMRGRAWADREQQSSCHPRRRRRRQRRLGRLASVNNEQDRLRTRDT